MTMTNLAMFNAVNCIEPKYQGYGMQPEPSPDTSPEAAAASAAGNLLIKLVPNDKTLPTQLREYLARMPDSPAKQRGVKLGAEVADKIVKLRDGDGTERTKNGFRPMTQPGVYTATLFQYGWEASDIKPMALTSSQQFRPVRTLTSKAKHGPRTTTKLRNSANATAPNALHSRPKMRGSG